MKLVKEGRTTFNVLSASLDHMVDDDQDGVSDSDGCTFLAPPPGDASILLTQVGIFSPTSCVSSLNQSGLKIATAVSPFLVENGRSRGAVCCQASCKDKLERLSPRAKLAKLLN